MSQAPPGGAPKWLLVSDIDDTLTGDAAALKELSGALERHRDRLWFAVNSSRPAASVAATLAEEFPDALRPDGVITAMGTEISVRGEPVASWQSRFAGWPHDKVFGILAGLGHRPHDAVFQTPRKVSFAVRGDQAQAQARRALADAGVECQVVASGADDFDVIPAGAGKAAATRHLASVFGIDRSRLVVAGDSGNDLAMFRAAELRIAVANARRELIDALEPGSFFHARGAHAAGVLEGLIHFGVIPARR